MRIANPIYDVVFKYLMVDQKIAKLLISKIIGEEIESIDFQPKEHVANVGYSKKEKSDISFTVYRLDFAAKIRTAEGELKTVIIEIQKAKLSTDIMRFRKYLGQQYMSESNSEECGNGSKKRKAFPIISIYFLGHSLEHQITPVIKVNRLYTDLATGEILPKKEEFIESLSHNSYVIQIPALRGKRRNELEKLLSIFDQSQKESNHHILNVNEDDYPEEFREVIRKLQRAVVDEEIQNTMDVEDEIIEELGNKEREIEDLKDTVSEQKSELLKKDDVITKKDSVISDQKSELSKKDKEIEELKKMLRQKK